MRIVRVRVGRANDFTQQHERWIGELIFFHDRIERNVFAVVAELAIRDVEHDSILDLCPVSVVRKEDELRIFVDELFDEPWARYAVHFNFLASDPFHAVCWRL